MNNEEDIRVINTSEHLSEDYTLFSKLEITNNNLKELLINKGDEYRTSNFKIKEDFIIIISTKFSNNKSLTHLNDKNLIIDGFNIRIINLNLTKENNDDKKEISILIPLKEPKIISNNNLFKYFFYDFIKIDESKSYFHVYVLGQLHIYKIYIKENQLKYNKIELKKFNEKTKVLYLGECFKPEENILEIELLLKPVNTFLFLVIDTNEKGGKIVEKEYEVKDKNAKKILNKFMRSYCGSFLFSEKETKKNYIINVEENDGEIQIKEAEINIVDDSFYYLNNISNKLYLISELTPEKLDEINDPFIVLGIFYLYNDEEKDRYNSQLIQKIMIKNIGGIKEHNININALNYISVQIGENLFFIHLNKKSSVDVIHKIYLNSSNLQLSNIKSEKLDNCSIILSNINSKIFLSTFYDNNENINKGKCIINYDTITIKDNEEDNKVKIDEEKSEIDEKESNTESDKEEIIKIKKNIMNLKIDDYIDKVVKEKVKIGNEKIEELKKEYEIKFEMIQQDINLQEKENEKLENNIKDLLIKISDIQQQMNNNDKIKEDIKENVNSISNSNNNYDKKKTFKFKNDEMNLNQYSNLKYWNQISQINPMKMLNPYYLMKTDNLLINSPMSLNDSRVFQLLKQKKNSLNQGNICFKNNNNKSEFPLNNFNFP